MLNGQTVLWHIDRILTGATLMGQGRPMNNGNEGVLYIL